VTSRRRAFPLLSSKRRWTIWPHRHPREQRGLRAIDRAFRSSLPPSGARRSSQSRRRSSGKAVLPAMKDAHYGRIINIPLSRENGEHPRRRALTASKAGMLGLTRAAARA
jgi:NAD(P)-dependent dehydrogenase (short-subunit alcohol dehydrogenase family)